MRRGILCRAILMVAIVLLISPKIALAVKSHDELIKGAHREEKEGWIYIHIEGDPYQLGYQRGYLVAEETDKALEVMKFYLKNATNKEWGWYRNAAKKQWEKIMPDEYKKEFEGMADGIAAAGVTGIDYLDLWAWNGWIDLAWYYLPTVSSAETEDETQFGIAPNLKRHPPGPGCSAFIATGDATRDGRIVLTHSLWYDYLFCNYWNVWMDMVPEKGYRIITQGFPGWIYGGTDFWINSGGLVVSETTISEFVGYNPKALPNFVRIRKAVQYANTIDAWIEIMVTSVNGAYANDWLIGDIKTGEIARLELGLKNYHIWRTFNGYYVGSNMALSPEVRKETVFDYNNLNSTAICRRLREIEFVEKYYGEIDVDIAKKFQADHYDPSHEKYIRTANTICGHVELDPRGLPEWGYDPYYPGGSICAEVTDSELADKMKLWAKWGHGCDYDFIAEDFLKEHPEYNWQKPYLSDIISYPWTTFEPMK
jgi:hypothetical protein